MDMGLAERMLLSPMTWRALIAASSSFEPGIRHSYHPRCFEESWCIQYRKVHLTRLRTHGDVL